MLDADKAERTAVSEKGTIKSTFLPEALEAALHDLGLVLARRTSARIDLHWLRDRFDGGALDLDPWLANVTGRAHHGRPPLLGDPAMPAKLLAEFLGTFWLVLGGCGSAVLAAAFPALGIGFTGVSLAFGLSVLTAAYALGPISGGHFNPAVSFGLWVGGRFPAAHLLPYWVAQLAGAIVAAAVLYVIATGHSGFDPSAGFASNGFGPLSPGKYSLGAAIVTEVVMTFMFLIVILGATHERAPVGFAGLTIGLALTLIHLVSIPVTNTSVNPARSTAPALFAGMAYVQQLWLFWLAPLVGAALGGLVYRMIPQHEIEPPVVGRPSS